jgi:hypothetical protein
MINYVVFSSLENCVSKKQNENIGTRTLDNCEDLHLIGPSYRLYINVFFHSLDKLVLEGLFTHTARVKCTYSVLDSDPVGSVINLGP